MVLYLLSFLDRINIDLGLRGTQFQTAVSLLFVTYLIIELPSNLIIKKVGPSRWIAFITTSWGIVATLTGLVQNYGGLVACRLLLGLFEGGLFPGLAIYLTIFYTKRELAVRVGYLIVAAAASGAFGGLLATAIGHMDGAAGQRGWRWILIIEGIPTVFAGICCWWLIADSPETASYLSVEEKELMMVRRRRQVEQTDSAQKLHRKDIVHALVDWKTWAIAIAQLSSNVMLYGFSTFLPTIIRGINASWSTPTVQALTVPCYVIGGSTFMGVAYLSDRYQRRGLPTVAFGCVSLAGYALLMGAADARPRYAGCFLAAMGLYVFVGLPIAWLAPNCPRFGKRTTASALQIAFGNVAGIVASYLYPTSDGPRYIRGHAVTLGFGALSVVCHSIVWRQYSQANTKRAAGTEDGLIEGMSEEEIRELGDRSPRFVYTV
ncbi:Major facilitator superfamily [Neofusicoccum parvum]|nr:Major facilitator superfamily [Neofusicoccum parvum]